MLEKVISHIDEAVAVAERCPPKYQVACFKALMEVLAEVAVAPPGVTSPTTSPVPMGHAEVSPFLNENTARLWLGQW